MNLDPDQLDASINYSREKDKLAEELVKETGGRRVDGLFHPFVVTPGEEDFVDSHRTDTDVVFRVEHLGFPGDPNRIKGSSRMKAVLEKPLDMGDFVTDDPMILKQRIERESGLVLGPRLVGESANYASSTKPEQYLLSLRPDLLHRNADAVGAVAVEIMTRAQYTAWKAEVSSKMPVKENFRRS